MNLSDQTFWGQIHQQTMPIPREPLPIHILEENSQNSTSVVCREEKKILEVQLRDARQEVGRVQIELEEVQAELSESKFMIRLPILLMFVKKMTITKTGIVINVRQESVTWTCLAVVGLLYHSPSLQESL